MVTLSIEHITRDASGRPCIAGTRIRVHDAALWHDGGMTVEEMLEGFDLTAGQVYAALSYYYDHHDEIQAQIKQEVDTTNAFLAAGHAIRSEDLRARIEARRKKS